MKNLTEKNLTDCINKRSPDTHKGDYGRVVLIGGNSQYGGAIIMATIACVKSGAGLVTTVSHPSNQSALHSHCPEAMFVDWTNTDKIKEICSSADVIVVGPGLGDEEHSISLLSEILNNNNPNQRVIIDGSAISLIGDNKVDFPKRIASSCIFTPHQKEWERLSGLNLSDQTEKNNVMKQNELGNPIIVLKQHRTEVYSSNEVYKNTVGTPAMATGGMGDTLAGMIGGFCAQFSPIENAVNAAVFLHSYIGEQLAREQYVTLPTDISSKIPFYMKQFEQ